MVNRKVILAERLPYENETLEEYTKVPFNKRVRAYLVLDTLKEGLLVNQLKYLENKSEQYLALLKSDYSGLNYGSVPTKNLTIIPEGYKIIAVVTDEINPIHFEKIVTFLRFNTIYNSSVKLSFSSFCEKYFKERIKVGTVVTILNPDNSYNVYYVKEKLDNDFVGVILHYDSSTGLSATDEEICIPYDSRYYSIAYSREYKDYVETLMNEYKLKKLKGSE